MKISRFVAKAKRVLPRAVLIARGKVLYSAADTLRCGELYVLGLNPGSPGQFTIAKRLDQLPTKITNDYLDECWRRGQGNYDKRKHPLQRNLDNLLKALGFETRSVCASNLIFRGSEDAKSCDYPRAADKCWPLHRRILDVVRPRVIVAFGNSSISPYDYLRHHGVVVHQGESGGSSRGTRVGNARHSQVPSMEEE